MRQRMAKSPTAEVNKQAGASRSASHARPAPGHYTSIPEEYQALTEGVALLDRSSIGRLSFAGEDALDLLNRLSTNELMHLEVDTGIPTVLTSNKGRIVDLLLVLRQADHLLVLTAPENGQKVADWIDFYTFAEDVAVSDVTEQTAMFSLAGPKTAPVLDKLTGQVVSGLGRYESRAATIAGVKVLLIRTDFVRLPGYDLIVPAADGQRLWDQLLRECESAGLAPAGTEALEVVRVEQGMPRYGKELSEGYNPLEANLLEFVSFTKGCYIGQEVVTRLNTYQKVQRHLVELRWHSDSMPIPDAKLLLDGKQVGVVTSAVRTPLLERGTGLGYVRNALAHPGVALRFESEDGLGEAQVMGTATNHTVS